MALVDRSGEPIAKDEVEAVLATRAELGEAYEVELAESFADRIEQVVQARVAEQSSGLVGRAKAASEAGHRQFVLGIVSLGCGIPITGAAAGIARTDGLVIAWAGIVGVIVAHAIQTRLAFHRR